MRTRIQSHRLSDILQAADRCTCRTDRVRRVTAELAISSEAIDMLRTHLHLNLYRRLKLARLYIVLHRVDQLVALLTLRTLLGDQYLMSSYRWASQRTSSSRTVTSFGIIYDNSKHSKWRMGLPRLCRLSELELEEELLRRPRQQLV